MPPASIASRVSSTTSVSPRASSSSSEEAGGNFGAPPKPPLRRSAPASRRCDRLRRGRPPPGSSARLDLADRARAARACAGARSRISSRWVSKASTTASITIRKLGIPRLSSGREVGAAVEGHAVGVEEDGHRPAAVAGDRLHRLHVDRVDVGALLAVDLDVDEVLVHVGGGLGVLEGLALHHVAPVAGRVADREQDRPVLLARPRQRLRAPRVPVDRVVPVLEQVGAGLLRRGGSASPSTYPAGGQVKYSPAGAR